MPVAVCLGNDFMGDDEDHGAGRQSQTDGIGGGEAAGETDAQQCTERLEQTAGNGDQHRVQRRKAGTAQGQGDGEPLGDVLQGDGQHKQ